MSRCSASLLLLGCLWAAAATAEQASNLCYNGSFNSTNGPLDGWNTDYRWMKNKHFMNNHEICQVLPSFNGKSNVLWVNPGLQARVESKPIPIEKGQRYKCTMDLMCGDTRFYFKGYKWEPGIAPHPDPKLWELRSVYRSEAYIAGGGGSQWKTISFEFPMTELSELAWKHYNEVRFVTVYMCRYRGGWHAANVRVEKIPGTVKMVKTPPPKPAAGGRQPTSTRKPGTPAAPKPSIIEDDNE